MSGKNYLRNFGVLLPVFVCLFLTAGCTGGARLSSTGQSPSTPAAVKQDEKSGIRIERVSLSASGLMIDLRYRVVDLQRAKELLTRQAKVFLVDQVSGHLFPVPRMAKVGRLLQFPGQGDENRVYWIFFNNPGGLVKTGSKVSLIIDDQKFEDIVVR
jgi:hypothetical protein